MTTNLLKAIQILRDGNIEEVETGVNQGWLTYKLCYKAVQIDPDCINGLPHNYMCGHICLAAVKADGKILSKIPNVYKTYLVCMIAFENGEDFKNIPTKWRARYILKNLESCSC